MQTPWGPSQHQQKITDGMYWVSTSGHGGLLIECRIAGKLLSPWAFSYGGRYGQWLAYEEDCDYQVAFFELPQYWPKLYQHRPNPQADRSADLLHSLSFWRADYLLAVGETPHLPNYAGFLNSRHEDTMREQNHHDLIVAARGDWHTGIEGVIEVTTADGKDHLVTGESYHDAYRPKGFIGALLSRCLLWQPDQLERR